MPIYEFQCDRCGEKFDKLMSYKDPVPACPACDASDVRKRVTAAGFVLKGGGWYKDHYGLKSGASSEGSSGGSSSSKGEGAKTEPTKTDGPKTEAPKTDAPKKAESKAVTA